MYIQKTSTSVTCRQLCSWELPWRAAEPRTLRNTGGNAQKYSGKKLELPGSQNNSRAKVVTDISFTSGNTCQHSSLTQEGNLRLPYPRLSNAAQFLPKAGCYFICNTANRFLPRDGTRDTSREQPSRCWQALEPFSPYCFSPPFA